MRKGNTSLQVLYLSAKSGFIFLLGFSETLGNWLPCTSAASRCEAAVCLYKYGTSTVLPAQQTFVKCPRQPSVKAQTRFSHRFLFLAVSIRAFALTVCPQHCSGTSCFPHCFILFNCDWTSAGKADSLGNPSIKSPNWNSSMLEENKEEVSFMWALYSLFSMLNGHCW